MSHMMDDDEIAGLTMAELKQQIKELQELITKSGILEANFRTAGQLLQELQHCTLQEPDIEFVKMFLAIRKAMDKKQKIKLAFGNNGIVTSWEIV